MLREKPIWGVPPCTPTVLVGAGAPNMGFPLSMRSLFYISRVWEDFLRQNGILCVFGISRPTLREMPILGVPACTPTVLVGAGTPRMGLSLSIGSEILKTRRNIFSREENFHKRKIKNKLLMLGRIAKEWGDLST